MKSGDYLSTTSPVQAKEFTFKQARSLTRTAHIRTKIDGILNDLEEKRRDIKQASNYIAVFMEAIKQQWTIGKIKAELSKARYVPYKGRTKYYGIVSDLLKDY